MDVPNLFTKPVDSGQDKLFLALVVTSSTVQAGLWKVSQGAISVLHRSSIKDYHDEKTLLLRADEALQDLGKLSENVDEVVFGFEFDWVSNKGIADDKKPFLKKLTGELSLKPVGFVVITEALYHFLTKQEPHQSALVLQYTDQSLAVTLIERGQLIKTEHVGRSNDSASDLTESLARFDSTVVKHLPSKILLVGLTLDQGELKKQQQALLKHQWQDTHTFLHPPTIDTLPEDTTIDAVIGEGGRAVAQSQGFQVLTSQASDQPQSEPSLGEEKAISDELADKAPLKTASSFGIPISLGGWGQTNSQNQVPPVTDESQIGETGETTISSPAGKAAGKFNFFKSVAKMMPKFGGKKSSETALADFPPPLDEDDSRQPSWLKSHKHFVIGGFVSGLLALLIIGYVAVAMSKQAVVKLMLKSDIVSDEVVITLDSTLNESDPEKLLLKADLITREETGSQSIETSGVKLVGEKATGRVTFFNKTDSEKTFEAGTSLSSGSLVFTLDEEVKIASASVSSSSGGETKTYGKAEAGITAVEIGADSNLGKDTELSIDDFSINTYSATVNDGLSGGSSREVRVVSKEDRAELIANLREELQVKAEAAFKQEAGEGKYVVPTGEVTIISTDFDAEIGDEVKNLSLDLTVEVSAASYRSEDLQPLVEFVLRDKVPSGFELVDTEPSILSQPQEGASGSAKVSLDTNLSVPIQPIIDQANWKQEISGQSPSSAEAILRGKPEVDDAKVSLTPLLARFISNSLPKKSESIIFEIESKQ